MGWKINGHGVVSMVGMVLFCFVLNAVEMSGWDNRELSIVRRFSKVL